MTAIPRRSEAISPLPPYQKLVPRYDEMSALFQLLLTGEMPRVTEHSPDTEPEGPLPLNEKVGRILHSLARSTFTKTSTGNERLEVPEEVVSAAIRAWRERACYLPGELFSDPAWGMLLELLDAEIRERQVSVSRLCKASAASTSSAIRWLKALEDRGLVIRRADPLISENEFLELTPKGSTALRLYFRDVAL